MEISVAFHHDHRIDIHIVGHGFYEQGSLGF